MGHCLTASFKATASIEITREQGPVELARAKIGIMLSIVMEETAIKQRRRRDNNKAGAN